MKNSGGKTKTVYKLKKRNTVLTCLIFLGVFMITLGGLLTTKSSLVDMLKFKASGDVPSHSKAIIDNEDGTWKLSLDIVGEAEKKAQKANVLIIFDTSSSMNQNTGNTETTYTPTSSTSTGLYGLIDGEYVPLTRTSTTSGPWWNQTTTYHFWYDGVEYTGQRYNQQVGNQTRIMAAKSAITNLADSLMSHNGVDGNADDTIEMAIVDFANMASTIQTPTNDKQTMLNAINSLSAGTGTSGRGTNWEAGLRHATNSNNINFNDNDPTYVIFVSDGNPTYYLENPNGSTTNNNNREGSGSETNPANNVQLSYNAALPAAQALTAKYGKDTFYTIGAYGNVTRMEGLTTGAGAPAGNYYAASNTAALQEALNDILEKIEMSGISKAKIEDGTTEAVKIESTDTNGMLVVDTNSFEYTITIPIDSSGKANIKGQEATLTGNTLTWGDNKSVTGTIDKDGNFVYKWIGENPLTDVAPTPAEDNGGTVTWDLSNVGVLINGAKYSVTFDVWPSQETYDLIADLKNGTKKYSELDSGITKYLSDTYELKTNTNAKITYTDTRNDAGEQESEYTNPDPVATNSSSISIKKVWDNELDSRTDRPVTVSLNRDGSNFITVNLDGTPDDEWETAAWEATGISIATGLARLSDDGELEVLDVGHDYKFSELGSEAYNWELETETVHPMLINGTLTKLLLVEDKDKSEIPSQLNEKDYYNGYYRLANGKVYKDAGTTNPQIKAINHRRSNFNLKKVVNGENANPNTEFEFTIRVTQKDEKDKVIADDSTTNDDDLWFSVQDKDGNWVDYGESIGEWTRYVGLDNQTGKTTYYYYAPNDKQLVIKLKADYNLRFTNLVSNTDISVVEGNTTNYPLEEITVIEGFDTENDSQTISGKTFTGHIGENNASYQVQYKNKNDVPETINIPVEKVWLHDNGGEEGLRTSVEVELFTVEGETETTTGKKLTLSESNQWKGTFENLVKYANGKEVTYTVKENTENSHYTTTVTGDNSGFTVTNDRDTTDITVDVKAKKVWDDANNQDGIRPKSVTFQLSDGTSLIEDKEIELNGETDQTGEDPAWEATFKQLPKYKNGQLATYTVEEKKTTVLTGIDGPETYAISKNTDETTGLITITNKHTPAVVSATVKKVWDDVSNQDGKRPTSISVQLKANGVAAQQGGKDVVATLTEANGWTATVSGLPLKANGVVINYTWTEDEKGLPEGYELTGTDKEGTVTTLTNSYTPEKDKITVTKIWDDASDQDGKRPDDVAFTVTGSDGKTYDATLSGDEDTWTQEVEVDKFYNGGEEVTFTVDEEAVADYQKSIDNSKLTITNSYTPEKDKITVTKIWDDASDQDGKRPDDVAFTVTGSDGKTYDATLSGDKDTWTKEVEVDKYYNEGQEVEFTVDEAEVKGYKKSIDNSKLTITNSYTPETTEATIKKVWEDDGDRDGKQPKTLKMTLNDADNTEVTLDENNNWSATISGLPKYANGQEIDYRWTEEEIAEYTIKSNGKEGLVQTITNHYDPELTYVCVKKVWDDDNDRDRVRPGTLTLGLTSDDESYEGTEVTLSADTWEATVERLFKYHNHGQKVTYTWTEKDLPEGYTLTNTEPSEVTDEETGLTGVVTTLTNTHNIALTEATVKKVWDDTDDQDGLRPETLSIKLLGDEKPVQKDGEDVVVTLSESTEWSATVKGLPLNDKGEAIDYTWEEVDLPTGYELTDTSLEGTVTTLTNTHTPEKIDIPVKKEWVNNDPYGFGNPASVVVNLLDNGKVVGTRTLSAGNNWTDTFTGLDKYRDGQPIPYEVKEEAVLDYDTEYQGSIAEGFTVVNTYNPTLIPIEVTKTWDDTNDQDGKRPETIKMTLIGKVNGEVKYTSATETVTDADYQNNNTWKHTFTGLPKRYLGQEIEYSVVETLADDSPYTETRVTDLEIKNSYNPQTITYSILKGWDDNDNQDGKRPESITVHLLQDGVEIETLTLNDESGWMIDFGPLPKYRDHGTEINYTIIEDPVKYYENTQTRYDKYEEDNYTAAIVVNTHEPEKAHIGIKKIWNDQDNKYKYRPESITVQILANGEVVDTVKLTAEGNWELDVVGLDKYANGKEIEYTIKELPVEHYTTTIDGFTITNTVEPPSEPEIIPPNTGIDGIGETASEKYLALLMAIITMFASVGVKRLYE